MAEKTSDAREVAGKKNDAAKESGIDRWKKGEGAAGGKARRRSRRRGRRRGLPKGAGSQILALVCALALVAASVAAAWPPAERLGWGIDLAGGTEYTYAADPVDDLDAAASAVRTRLERMGLSGCSVTATGDGISVRVPAGQDGSSAVEEAVGAGRVEFVRADSVSDAETLARLQNSASGVTLEEGTYEAFIDGSSITSASAVATQLGSYGLQFSFDSGASQTFEQVTSELAPVYGQILIVVDGTVVAAPQVSSAIEGGQVSVSAGLSQQQAEAIAAAVETGELPVTLTQQGTSEVAPVVDAGSTLQAVVAAGVVVLALLVALLVWLRLLGLVAWAGLVALCVFEVGGLALLSGEGLFVPSVTAYLGAAVAAVLAFAECLRALAAVRSRMRSGTNARDAVRSATRAQARELAFVACVLAAGGLVAYFLVPIEGLGRNSAGLAFPVAVVAAALALVLVVFPLLRLAALGPMRSHPGAWGVARTASDES